MKYDYRIKDKSFASKRGSALIGAAICSFVVGLLAVSYLKMASNEYRASMRSTLYSSALNLAESGVELAISDLNSSSVSGSTWTGTSLGFLQDGPTSGDVYYVILNAQTSTPTIYAQGVVSGHPSGDVTKQVRVELSSGFPPFDKGLAARNGITFSGNGVMMDSYNSNYGAYDSLLSASTYTGIIPTDFGDNGYNRNDDIYIASSKVDAYDTDAAISQGNADVYGYVTVGPTSTVSIGPQGMVTSYDTGTHDASRVLSDFYADFPVIEEPGGLSGGGSTGAISNTTTLTGVGTKEAPTQFDVDSISLGGSKILTISGHVRLIMDGDISLAGNAQIIIASGGSLTIYTADDVSIAGNGVTNTDGVASDFYIYGTADTAVDASGDTIAGQSISISGNGQLAATVYAPSADVSMNGGGTSGSIMGGIVGFTAKVTGGSQFHFDEALRDVIFGGGTYSIESWLEMTGETAGTTPISFSAYSF